jgi:hypothetical protein
MDLRGATLRNNLVKDENGDLLADSHNILNRWKNYCSQLLNVHNVSDVRQIEIRMAEPLAPGPSHLEVEIAIAKLKKYKSPGSDQIPAELIQAGGEILLSEIHKLSNSVWNKEELPDQWKESIIVPIHKKGDKTDCNKYRGNLLGDNIDTLKKNMVTLIDVSTEVGLEIKIEKPKYMLLSHHRNAGQNWDTEIANSSFENVSQFKYLGRTVFDSGGN